MDRTRLYTQFRVDETDELDFMYNNLSEFVMRYPVSYYRVDETDILRPDVISYKNYGTVKYWWLVCYVNQIADPFFGITVGQLLKIPNILDVYDFYKRTRVR